MITFALMIDAEPKPLLRREDDFLDLFAVAADELGIRPDVVEKDYWVSQALRGLQLAFPETTSSSRVCGGVRPHERVEKLILVNTVAEEAHSDLAAIEQARVGRHFYDIHCLLAHDDACALLADADSFNTVVADSERISHAHFGGCVERPSDGYASGPAFRGESAVMVALEAHYDTVMAAFYFGQPPHPPFADVLARVEEHARLL